MKRTLSLLFLSSSAFIVAPVAAQEGSGGVASVDASVPDPTDAAPGGGGSSSGSGGASSSSGGGKGSGGKAAGPPPLEPIDAAIREYDLLENEGKSCSMASVAGSRGDGAAFILASAAAAMATRRRRAGRKD